MALQIINSMAIDNGGYSSTLQLCVGDLTDMGTEDWVNFLVVSALPGDYTPSPGSLIGSLNQAGISVQQLSENKAASYEPKIPCWISGPVSSSNGGIQFSNILVFEPNNPSTDAAGLAWTIFQALQCFQGSNSTSVAIPLVCTGSGGASYQDIIQALFYAATYAGALISFFIPIIKIVAFNEEELGKIQDTYNQLHDNYQNLVNLDLPGGYQTYAPDVWNAVQGMSLPTGLSKRQAFGIRMWTSNYYSMINGTLRNTSNVPLSTLMPLINAIDAGLANLSAFQGMTYRGEGHMSAERLDQYEPGNSILEPGYTSSALPAGIWYNSLAYKFNINGLTSRSIAAYSIYSSEDEYLYPRNMTTLVTGRDCNGDNSQCTFTVQETTINYCNPEMEAFIDNTVIAIH